MNNKKFELKTFEFSKLKKDSFNIFLIVSIFGYFLMFTLGSIPLIKYIISYLKNLNLITNNANDTLLTFSLKTILLYIFGFALPYFIYTLVFKYKPKFLKLDTLKNNSKILLNNIFISILLGFTLQPVGMGISALSTLITGSNTATSAISQLDISGSIFAASIVLAVCPAIFEELIYRGIIFDTSKKHFNLKVSAILSGIMFGLMHMNFQQFAYAAFLGTFFAFIYDKTKNILDTMIIHFVINFSQFTLSFMLFKNMGHELESANAEAELPLSTMIISTLILSSILIIPFYKMCISLYKKYKTLD